MLKLPPPLHASRSVMQDTASKAASIRGFVTCRRSTFIPRDSTIDPPGASLKRAPSECNLFHGPVRQVFADVADSVSARWGGSLFSCRSVVSSVDGDTSLSFYCATAVTRLVFYQITLQAAGPN